MTHTQMQLQTTNSCFQKNQPCSGICFDCLKLNYLAAKLREKKKKVTFCRYQRNFWHVNLVLRLEKMSFSSLLGVMIAFNRSMFRLDKPEDKSIHYVEKESDNVSINRMKIGYFESKPFCYQVPMLLFFSFRSLEKLLRIFFLKIKSIANIQIYN